MKINYVKARPDCTDLSDFADQNGLTITVTDHAENVEELFMRYTAKFDGVQIVKNGILVSEFGRGSTQFYAIDAYCVVIRGETILLPNNVRVKVPKNLIYKEKE